MNFWRFGLPLPNLDGELWNYNQHEEKPTNHLLIQKTFKRLLSGKHHAGYCGVLALRMLIIWSCCRDLKDSHLRGKLRFRGAPWLVTGVIHDLCHPIACEVWFSWSNWLVFSSFPIPQWASLTNLRSHQWVWPFHLVEDHPLAKV